MRAWAADYHRDRTADQDVPIEIWVEATGMVPQVARVAHTSGADVYSCGGFDSLTAKYEAAQRAIDRAIPTVVLHVGDHDAAGLVIFASVAEDVSQMVADLGEPGIIDFHRIAVTEEQIDRYSLPGVPP